MKSHVIWILVGLGLVVAVGAFVFMQNQERLMESTETSADSETLNPEATTTTPTATTTTQASSGITATEVATHNTRTSCWSTINGAVYDLTSWIPNHPGGEQAILQLCGTDGSEKFNRKHGGAPRQAAILAGFKIGVAAK